MRDEKHEGFVYCDGGRAEAGFKGDTGDCVVRAIAIATEIPYPEVYNALNTLAKGERPSARRKRSASRSGVWRRTYERYLKSVGWKWVPCMSIGTGCKVHLRASELPSGRIITRLSKHLCAVIDGIIYDTHDPREKEWMRFGEDGRTIPIPRCVYGYFVKEN